jgi:intracellular multiplication protein IcmE
MSISALAIREADAKQGVAENIDNHTLERYGSLIFASIASGIGKAASMDTGTTVIYPNGSTVTQQDSMTPKRVAGIAIGEVGTNAAQEIRKNFNMPTTYSLPANVGVGVFFLNDVQKPTE